MSGIKTAILPSGAASLLLHLSRSIQSWYTSRSFHGPDTSSEGRRIFVTLQHYHILSCSTSSARNVGLTSGRSNAQQPLGWASCIHRSPCTSGYSTNLQASCSPTNLGSLARYLGIASSTKRYEAEPPLLKASLIALPPQVAGHSGKRRRKKVEVADQEGSGGPDRKRQTKMAFEFPSSDRWCTRSFMFVSDGWRASLAYRYTKRCVKIPMVRSPMAVSFLSNAPNLLTMINSLFT